MKIIIKENFFENLDKNRLPQASGFNHLNEGIGEFAAGLVGGLATLIGSVMSGLGLLSSLSGLFVGSLAAFSVSAYKNMKYNRSEIGKANNIAIKDIVRDTANDGAYKSYLTAYLNKLGRSYNLYDIVERYNEVMGIQNVLDNKQQKDAEIEGDNDVFDTPEAKQKAKQGITDATNEQKELFKKQESSAKMAFFSIVGIPQINFMLRKFYQSSGFLGGFTTGNKSLDNTFKNAISGALANTNNLLFMAKNFKANVRLSHKNLPQNNPDNSDLNFETPKQTTPVATNVSAVNDGYSIPVSVFKQFFVAESDMFFQKNLVNEEGTFGRVANNAKQTVSNWWNKSRDINPMQDISNITNGLGLKSDFIQMLNKSLMENPQDVEKIAGGDYVLLANHLYTILTPSVLQYANKFVAADKNFEEIQKVLKSLFNSEGLKKGIADRLKNDLPNFIKKK